MNPIKQIIPLTTRLLALSFAALIIYKYHSTFSAFDYKNYLTYIDVLMVICVALLALGVLFGKTLITLISSIVLSIVFIYKIVILVKGGLSIHLELIEYVLMLSLSLNYVSRGNQ